MSRARCLLSALVLVVAACAVAAGQGNVTVQQPTFNFATTSTTVNVPDGGTGLLGGIMRASEGSVTRGVPILSKIPFVNRLFKNRGIGRDVSAWNMTVVPRIIIPEEEELRQTGFSPDMLSGTGGGFGGAAQSPAAGKAAFIARNLGRNESGSPAVDADERLPSVAEILRQNGLADAARSAEAAEFFAKGQRAEAEGKSGVARIYYQMALRRAGAAERGVIADRLARLDRGGAESRPFAQR